MVATIKTSVTSTNSTFIKQQRWSQDRGINTTYKVHWKILECAVGFPISPYFPHLDPMSTVTQYLGIYTTYDIGLRGSQLPMVAEALPRATAQYTA